MHNCSSPALTKRIGLATIGRGALWVVIAVAAWYVGSGFVATYRESQVVVPPPANSSTAVEFNAMASVLPLAGPWTFADANWDLQSRVVTRVEVDRRLQELSNASPGVQVAELPDISPELSDYVAKLQLTPIERAGNIVYLVDKPTFKAELVLRESSGKMKTVKIAGGIPATADGWQMFEIAPRGLTPGAKSSESHLLPLPAGASRKGGRFADDGRLLLELISLDTNSDALVAAWKSAGWEVRPSGLSNVPGFSVLCARGNDVIYAWSANASGSLKDLMLVRSPSDAELQAEQSTTTASSSK